MGAEPAILTYVVVDAGQLNPADVRCPMCGSNTLVLSGLAQIPQREIVENGVVVEKIPGSYEDGSFDLQEIDCPACSVKFLITNHESFKLSKENLNLKTVLKKHGITVKVDEKLNF